MFLLSSSGSCSSSLSAAILSHIDPAIAIVCRKKLHLSIIAVSILFAQRGKAIRLGIGITHGIIYPLYHLVHFVIQQKNAIIE